MGAKQNNILEGNQKNWKGNFDASRPSQYFIFKFDLKVKHLSYFSNKNHGLHKKLFKENFVFFRLRKNY